MTLLHGALLAHWWVHGGSSLFLCVLGWWCSAGAFRKLLGFGRPVRVQEKGEVTLSLNGERLVGGKDVVPLSSWADLLEGCCGRDVDRASEFLDRATACLPAPTLPPAPSWLTCTICRAALAPRAPRFTHAAAAELAGEASGQRVLALVLGAHHAETQALFLRFVSCRSGSGGLHLSSARAPLPLLLWFVNSGFICGPVLMGLPETYVNTDS